MELGNNMKVTRKILKSIGEFEVIKYGNYIHYLGTDVYYGYAGALINGNYDLEIAARDELIAIYENNIIPNLIKIIKENL